MATASRHRVATGIARAHRWPFVWVLGLPFRLIGISVSAAFDLIEMIIRMPARLLRGHSPGHTVMP